MEKQVLSIEQMQHLEELGVDTSKANFYWHRTKSFNNYEEWDEWKLYYGVLKLARGFTTVNCEYVRTFTLQDILDLLPGIVYLNNSKIFDELWLELGANEPHNKSWYIKYCFLGDYIHKYIERDSLIDAAYEMLCWVIENGYLKVK